MGKSNRSADAPFEIFTSYTRYIFFQKRSPAGLLVLGNIRSPFYFVLTSREMLRSAVLGQKKSRLDKCINLSFISDQNSVVKCFCLKALSAHGILTTQI